MRKYYLQNNNFEKLGLICGDTLFFDETRKPDIGDLSLMVSNCGACVVWYTGHDRVGLPIVCKNLSDFPHTYSIPIDAKLVGRAAYALRGENKISWMF